MHLLVRSDIAAAQAPQLLENPEVLFKHHCRPEVRELLTAAWPGLAGETKAAVLELISTGPDVSRLHIDVEGNAEIVRTYRDEVLLALLEPLDSLLDDERQLWLDQLRAARGPIEPMPRSGWMHQGGGRVRLLLDLGTTESRRGRRAAGADVEAGRREVGRCPRGIHALGQQGFVQLRALLD